MTKIVDDLERLLLAARAQIVTAPDAAALDQIRVALLGNCLLYTSPSPRD